MIRYIRRRRHRRTLDRIRRLERELGISDQECVFHGCDKAAAAASDYCDGHHYIFDAQDEWYERYHPNNPDWKYVRERRIAERAASEAAS